MKWTLSDILIENKQTLFHIMMADIELNHIHYDLS